jgi:D-serine deaminase-like pyridoxal phosphate-dependent protein
VKLQDLPTPCAVVDLDRVEHNVERFSARARRLGVRLRPHVKTHKCLEAARLQVEGHFGGITVSTLAEARCFAHGGFTDITYAVPIPTDRLAEAVVLARRVDRLNLLVDQTTTVEAAEEVARATGSSIDLFLEVDSGGGRTGVDPESDDGVRLAQRIAASSDLELRGILTHAGQAYDCRNRDAALEVGTLERDVMTGFAARLASAGVPVQEISVGSTPGFAAVGDLAGVTEARPGNYAFFDAFQAAIGTCTLDEVAFSVLVTVIGVYPRRREVVVNGGALALSKDPGPVHVDPDCGYGVVASAYGTRPIHTLRVVALTQEHGVIRAAGELDLHQLEVGTRLRILPNHSCLAAALHDRYWVARDEKVVGEWRPVRGW